MIERQIQPTVVFAFPHFLLQLQILCVIMKTETHTGGAYVRKSVESE